MDWDGEPLTQAERNCLRQNLLLPRGQGDELVDILPEKADGRFGACYVDRISRKILPLDYMMDPINVIC